MKTKSVRITQAAKKTTLVLVTLSALFSACRRDDDTDIPVINSDINTATTWADEREGVDYIVDGCISVNGVLLTVEPNVTVQFRSGSCLILNEGGALKAAGTEDATITFEGVQNVKGYWKGIYYQNSNSAENRLQYITVRDAGGSNDAFRNAAINIGTIPIIGENASRVKLNHVTVSNSQNYGLYISNHAIIDQFENNTISNCDKAPIQLMASNCGVLNSNNTYSGNGYNYVEINGSMVQNSSTLANTSIPRLSIPYSMLGDFVVLHDVTVEPGTLFKMQSNARIYVGDNGSFTATGSSSQRISFTGSQNSKGYWEGFVLEYNGTLVLQYCDITDAGNANSGSPNPTGAISALGFGNNVLTVQNSGISNSLNNGIAVNDPQVNYNSDIQTGNTFSNIDGSNFLVY